ncbi:12234_t:CDS:2 [Entrophospora sp. SA101]|nr:12234_t:CDS:2 [Entrophospora sp. SA101]
MTTSTSISSSQSTEMRHMRPYVHYHCSCPDLLKPEDDKEETKVVSKVSDVVTTLTEETETETETTTTITTTKTITTLPPFNINSPRFHFTTFNISKLYFCDDCHQIRCPRCVQEEIVCYYCPNCLFEVPTATVSPSATPALISGAPYYLSCGVCRWDSQEIGMTFEKATGLALQLQKTEDERPDVKEFDHLKEHFEKHLRHTTPATTLPTSLMTITGIGGGSSFSSRYGSGTVAGNAQQKSDDLPLYEAVVKVENENSLVDDLVQLKDVNQITTLMQRMNQLSDQPYKRIHLRTKRIKRCRQCRHILIKPEQKAQATRFKIKLVALAYIPKITIMSLPKLILNQTTQIVLKFSNPLYEEIILDLNVQDVELGKIKVLAPHFSIAPYNEVWEYDEHDLISSKPRSHTSPKSDIGIYERRSNSTSIILEITPEVEVEEFKFALLVTYATKNVDNNNESTIASTDTKSDDKDNTTKTDPESNESSDKSAVGSKTNDTDTQTKDNSTKRAKKISFSSTSPNNNDQAMKNLSFWTVIGLGSVVKTGPSNRHTISSPGGTSNISLSRSINMKSRPQSQA